MMMLLVLTVVAVAGALLASAVVEAVWLVRYRLVFVASLSAVVSAAAEASATASPVSSDLRGPIVGPLCQSSVAVVAVVAAGPDSVAGSRSQAHCPIPRPNIRGRRATRLSS